MVDDERQRVFVSRTNVNEMNVESIDLGDEVRQGVQSCLDLAPVVICCPVAREFLHRCKRHTLRLISDGLLFDPLRCCDTATEIDECLLREVDVEGTDCGCVSGLRNSSLSRGNFL